MAPASPPPMAQRLLLNRRLGWVLLLAGTAWGCWLDPQSVAGPAGDAAIHLRQAQLALFEMGLLQLLVAVVADRAREAGPVRAASRLTAGGSLCTALGWGSRPPARGSWRAASS